MDLSVFLAKILGLYMFFMALGMYVNLNKLKDMMSQENGPLFMFASGTRSLLFGLVIIACHNIWDGDYWKTVITLFGWALFSRGIVRLLLPDYSYLIVMKVLRSQTLFSSLSLLLLITGCYLTYFGFSFVN